ncbi:hypothetical protein OIU79_013700 [Salix purpurea]|uniref:Uncharacterized protein n=1 Tax=Salix purpurea TaxID=77065 RepID=A0A9Q0SW85_SALPP|nr:hypothetical protein OIU79_013700 [Salix purpurea]
MPTEKAEAGAEGTRERNESKAASLREKFSRSSDGGDCRVVWVSNEVVVVEEEGRGKREEDGGGVGGAGNRIGKMGMGMGMGRDSGG